MATLKFVCEVATSASEPPTEHFARGTDSAMVVLSPACQATNHVSPAGEGTNHLADLAVGPLIDELAVSHEGKSTSKDFLPTVMKENLKSNVGVIESADHGAAGSLFKSFPEHHTHSSSCDMMRNEILSALDHFHEENSRRITSSVKDLADAFIKLIPFKRRMDPEASPAKDEANAKEGEDKSNHGSVKCSKSKSKNQSDGSTVKVTSSGSNRTSPPQLMIEQHRRYLLRQIGRDDVKENVPAKPIERSFLDMLDSSIGAGLTQDMKNKINDLLIQHFGHDENCIDERAKNLLIDVFVLLSNSKPIVPENTNVNLNEDDKSKFNDDSSIHDANTHKTPKVKDQNTCNDNAIGNEQTPMKISSSPKDKIAVVDGIMKKLSKPGLSNTSPKKVISSLVGFNERKSIFLGHEKPSFKIWDSDDDFPNEEEHFKAQIIPKDMSQDFDDISQSQLNNSTNEDKLVMITLEDTDTEILTQHNEKENLNIEQLQKKDSPDVIFLGERQCPDNCFDITSKTNVWYNKINTFVVKPDKKFKMSTGSPERILLCNVDKSVGQCSTSQKPKHDLRRILQPARYSIDPYSPVRHSFPVTQYDRQVYNAVCKISKSTFQDKVAVDIDGVHCIFYTFGDSFKPSGELSNFIACVFCRYMFRSCHPSKSKKHYFFSSIGDDLLKDRSMTNFSAVKKCFDGASLARPVHTCDLLFFPIVKSRHWFVFVVDLKSERFVFLDSLYDDESFYHAELRPKLISNFSLAWNLYVQDHSIDFNRFSVIYPPVPKQNNRFGMGTKSTSSKYFFPERYTQFEDSVNEQNVVPSPQFYSLLRFLSTPK
uniref:Ubiquitin-like protease family profile domain-containing protein n=1 Tax=Oryza meridionalis TaxID=40149 RepID=A0A0E0E9C6_9ORYZ